MNKSPYMLRLLVNQNRNLPKRLYSEVSSSSTPSPAPPSQPKPASQEVNVAGLSKKVLDVPPTAVGPGASKTSEYKNPEYFSYNNTSYFEAEIEMLKYRLPQPSSL